MEWTVPKAWPGETCVIIAGGPSLREMYPEIEHLRPQVVEVTKIGDSSRRYEKVRYARVIAINDSWRLAPWADTHYFCDPRWWKMQIDMNKFSLDGRVRFHDLIYHGFWINGGTGAYKDHPQVRQLRFSGPEGLDPDPGYLRHGSNSGYQAIHLAYHYGVKRIILLGYDMHTNNGRTHWHDESRPDNFGQILAQSMLPKFSSLVEPLAEAGVEVLNATPGSALTCWPQVPLKEALQASEVNV